MYNTIVGMSEVGRVSTRILAQHRDLVLLSVDCEDGTMPDGYMEVAKFDPSDDTEWDPFCDVGMASGIDRYSKDEEAVIAQWTEYWEHQMWDPFPAVQFTERACRRLHRIVVTFFEVLKSSCPADL